LILSLFSGCGGLDLGFEMAGFETGLAFDLRSHSISSWNRNRPNNGGGHVGDVTQLTLNDLDEAFGTKFEPTGVIGGPPCQSFSRANHFRSETDPRNKLVREYFSLALRIHRQRHPLKFIVMENVRELANAEDGRLLRTEINRLNRAGFNVSSLELNAHDYGVPQNRHRLFLIALNKKYYKGGVIEPPTKSEKKLTVQDAIKSFPDPVFFSEVKNNSKNPFHQNHWCMTPKSKRFFDGSLKEGGSSGRSFKTLAWDRPSLAVSYGHREVCLAPRFCAISD
jgi:DNA (cytosine-5)-methyltransferase 1